YNALVLNGDICNGNKSDYENYATQVKQVKPIPYFPLVGNHELYFGGWSSYLSYFGSSTYYFTIKTNQSEDLFICLDTGSGTLGSKQLEWFKNLLKTKRSTFRNCIIFTHNNLYRIRHTSSTNPLTEELMVLTELFARYKVNIVVAGHDHQKNIVSLGNTNHITLNAMLDGFNHADFLTLSCTNGELEYQFTDLK
ncbi:MAG: metallophosphoesterase, partial [Paludibacter sp.]|nr:metallophosphoesterase [Paludibacter sp.]